MQFTKCVKAFTDDEFKGYKVFKDKINIISHYVQNWCLTQKRYQVGRVGKNFQKFGIWPIFWGYPGESIIG